ncbi:hypothetical protein V3C99_018409 [Haemonchus contortus]|uniref:Uncharacterized protein n=1 Tax=Haemonchus contortus TaxID=6289 RepID=A0A7I5EE98_HAECO
MISHDEKGVLSNENARDIFYAILDAVNNIKRKQDRMEDRLRRIDERTHALEVWTQRAMEVPRPDAPQCPTVAPIRYCEVCYVVGHQAATITVVVQIIATAILAPPQCCWLTTSPPNHLT